MTDASGQVTLANTYEPYGNLAQTAGSAQTSYGFTGELTDPSGMVYLRARMYNPSDGRFLTRDTWMGEYNRPLSLNRWGYVEGNPVNLVDPSGHCIRDINDLATAKQYVLPVSGDSLTTYTAAAIAVQCWGTPVDVAPGYYNGRGIAQITTAQTEEAYGSPVNDPGLIILGIVIRNPAVRGYGLRCYIPIETNDSSLCNCVTPRDIKQMTAEQRKVFESAYELESVHDPVREPKWAVEYMKRRIKQVLETCNYGKISCSETDKFIIAALAQNGSGFTIANVDQSIKVNTNPPFLINGKVQWKAYFPSQDNEAEFKTQLSLFYGFALALKKDGYYLPDDILKTENKKLIEDLYNGRYTN